MIVKGKKALVFGGTSGIGLAAAIMLRDGGCEVVAISRDPGSAQITTDGVQGIKTLANNVLDKAALQDLFAAQAPFDILISAATGGERAFGPFLEMDMDGYAASFDKLWGYANVIRFGTEHLPPDGCIVLVSGTPAKRAKPGQISLASVGASVEHLTRSVAAELAPRRINCVSPGLIGTPMHTDGSPEKEQRLLNNTAGNLIPRPGTAEECAQAIMFCVTNDFTTGNTIDVDGGVLSANL